MCKGNVSANNGFFQNQTCVSQGIPSSNVNNGNVVSIFAKVSLTTLDDMHVYGIHINDMVLICTSICTSIWCTAICTSIWC